MAKAGRPKNRRPHEIKLVLPKHPLKYKAKRLYWAMMEMEKKMSKDITSVRMTEYNATLSAYVEVVEALAKEGIKYKYDVKKGMDKGGTGQGSTEQDTEATSSGDGSADLGAGVRAINPIT